MLYCTLSFAVFQLFLAFPYLCSLLSYINLKLPAEMVESSKISAVTTKGGIKEESESVTTLRREICRLGS